VNALKGLVDVTIWLVVYLAPLLLFIATPIILLILLVRWLRRRRARARQA
jgi:Flp pilus assembly protein TadB